MRRRTSQRKRHQLEVFLVVVSLFAILGLLNLFEVYFTGFVVFTPQEDLWNFSDSSLYSYNLSVVSFNNSVVSLVHFSKSVSVSFSFPSSFYFNSSEVSFADGRASLIEHTLFASYILRDGDAGYSSTEDSWIKSDEEDETFGLYDSHKVRDEDDDDHERYLIRFRDVFSTLPSDANITQATLYLRVEGDDDDGTLSLYELRRDWIEGNVNGKLDESGEQGVTWTDAQAYGDGTASVSWEAGGASGSSDRGQSVVSSVDVPSDEETVSFDVTSSILSWKNGEPNYGWIIVGDDEGAKKVFSSKHSNSGKRPLLTINYTRPFFSSSAQLITLSSPLSFSDGFNFTGFSADGSGVSFQLSPDNQTWYAYVDGAWQPSYETTLISSLSEGISSFPFSPTLYVRTYLDGNNTSWVEGFSLSYASYPFFGLIRTSALSLPVVNSTGIFLADYDGNVSFNYSFNDGDSWTLVDANSTISLLNESNLTFNAELAFSGGLSPVLRSFSLSYASCIESWECSLWSSCFPNSTRSRSCSDSSSCGTTLLIPSLVSSCVYYPPNYTLPSDTTHLIGLVHNRTTTIDVNSTMISLTSSEDFSNISVIVATNISLPSSPSSVSLVGLARNITFTNQSLNSALINASLTFFYDPSDLASLGVSENSLRIYYYNDSSSSWEILDSFVNTTDYSVYALVNHFSLYALFGESGSSSSSSSGGGSRRRDKTLTGVFTEPSLLQESGESSSSKEPTSLTTCFDSVLNQGEEDIDCGGPCAACTSQDLLPSKPEESSSDRGFITGLFNFEKDILSHLSISNVVALFVTIAFASYYLFFHSFRRFRKEENR